jgi:hypothetical protein
VAVAGTFGAGTEIIAILKVLAMVVQTDGTSNNSVAATKTIVNAAQGNLGGRFNCNNKCRWRRRFW